ncbi:MAG: methylmalonyl Co-A mutase-associated GTPase MeaB [Planctomycetota bacterium]|jgi:LAO/AO transport system kinase
MNDQEVAELHAAVLRGERRALARTITLLESTRADHVRAGQAVLDALVPHSGGATRVGVTGPPGVGKSTFIEALGLLLADAGHRLAVLAVDPSSPVTGGSILGDKTRMERLARHPSAFIRPSPSGGSLGGVAERTREAMLACEAAGHDVVLIETVGIGQSEVTVSGMVDFFLVLLQPGSGDELQGIKKGVLELADGLVVNKADGELVKAAERTRSEFSQALQLVRHLTASWSPRVLTASARTGEGVAEAWAMIQEQRAALEASGEAAARRRDQSRAWMWSLVDDGLRRALREHPAVAARIAKLESEVESSRTTPARAARALLAAFRSA